MITSPAGSVRFSAVVTGFGQKKTGKGKERSTSSDEMKKVIAVVRGHRRPYTKGDHRPSRRKTVTRVTFCCGE